MGNRLTKTASSVTTNYWWDENNDLPMLALEAQGGTALRDYQYGDRLLSMNTSAGVMYFHHDDLGTTAAITKSTGATEWTYTYDPYGNPRTTTKVDSNAPDNPIQYTGQLIDPETGLYDLRARTYNPSNGRFLTIDPLTPSAGQPGVSAYLYASAQPLLLTDPSGEMPIFDPCFGWSVERSQYNAEACGGTAARAAHMLEVITEETRQTNSPTKDKSKKPESSSDYANTHSYRCVADHSWGNKDDCFWTLTVVTPPAPYDSKKDYSSDGGAFGLYEDIFNKPSYDHDLCYGSQIYTKAECDAQFVDECEQACYQAWGGFQQVNVLNDCVKTAVKAVVLIHFLGNGHYKPRRSRKQP